MKIFKIKLCLISLATLFATSIFFTSCQKEVSDLPENLETIEEIPSMDNLPMDDHTVEVEFEPQLVATIQKDGHEITFETLGDPDLGDFIVSEKLYGDAFVNSEEFQMDKSRYKDLDALDFYLAITDQRTLVPHYLAATSKNQEELEGRSIAEDNTPVKLLDENFSEPIPMRSCYNQDIGDYDFKHQHCKSPVKTSCNASQKWINVCQYDRNRSTVMMLSKCPFTWRNVDRVDVKTLSVCATTWTTIYTWNNGWKFKLRIFSFPYSGVTKKRLYLPTAPAYVSAIRKSGSGFYRVSSEFRIR